ncbi:hypothetical protein ACAG26_20285 [Mycobacterium sp. pUA109]
MTIRDTLLHKANRVSAPIHIRAPRAERSTVADVLTVSSSGAASSLRARQ